MRIEILGAGPAGLYFAILMKKAFPATSIRIRERNRADLGPASANRRNTSA